VRPNLGTMPTAPTSRVAAAASLLLTLQACTEVDPARANCVAGLWRSATDAAFALNVREAATLRITAFDGRVWTLAPQDAHWRGSAGQTAASADAMLDDRNCSNGKLWLTHERERIELRKVALEQRAVRFASGTETLTGKLVVPAGAEPEALVVLLHGSEARSGIAANPLQYLLPSQNIAAFVFDKRGTGNSAGAYTQNLKVLASDASHAVLAARRALGRPAKTVLMGGSQGAWVAPLTAATAQTGARPDRVIAAYGLAQPPIEEDREEVFDDLRRKGFGDAATLAKAREITDAAAAVMRSNFKSGLDRLDSLKAKYGNEPWYGAIEGEFTGDFLAMPSWFLGLIGPFFDEGMTWDYDPRPVIEHLDTPMLWVLAGQDSEAPPRTTLQFLRRLQTEKARPIDIAVFDRAEHAMVLFRETAGERTPTAFAPGYFALLATWIRSNELPPAQPDVMNYPKLR
jgi:uncharacterized protein